MSRTARCACGQLSIKCDGEPDLVSACHCLECQRRTGSAFGVAAFFLATNVAIQGDTNCYERSADSGFSVTHHFCPRCGSTVFWLPARKPEHVAVALGAFADPSFPAPSKSVYEQHRHAWVRLLL
ncbi:MAG: GFA family protein [Rhizobiaceae bacterium]